MPRPIFDYTNPLVTRRVDKLLTMFRKTKWTFGAGLFLDKESALQHGNAASLLDTLPVDNDAEEILMLGDWYVVEYYASAEEALSYSCMKAVFTEDDHVPTADGSIEFTPGVTMNFTYRFADDPLGENLLGNITWRVDLNEPAHWTHAEKTYDGIYNTYVLDTEYKTWALLLHCAEQLEGARYLSAFVLSRTTTLPKNVMAYLRDKLPRYDVDVNYVFPIPHKDCSIKPARFDYTPILVEVDSKIPKRPGVSYKVAFGH